jgi:hypothetical protein
MLQSNQTIATKRRTAFKFRVKKSNQSVVGFTTLTCDTGTTTIPTFSQGCAPSLVCG